MIRFILNEKLVHPEKNPGSTLLDYIRYDEHLVGTKIGCREGDCGACTVLVGEENQGKIKYQSITSCITPLRNVAGKHVVTIEGLNQEKLTPYQQAMVDESGQQCGFCTVGFILSFAGECLSPEPNSYEGVLSAIDGNICRCTGYKSIERASKIIVEQLKDKDLKNTVSWLVKKQYIPEYFVDIPNRLSKIETEEFSSGNILVGGGTDLLVQKPDTIYESNISTINQRNLSGIKKIENQIIIGASTTTSELLHSKILHNVFPNLRKHLKLVSSTPIRNMATVAGNFINASPIGDLTVFFLALDAEVELESHKGQKRIVKLKDLYKGYKDLDMDENEFMLSVKFRVPDAQTLFNFEKVSKRRYLDIASVNTAMSIKTVDGVILDIHLSAGGVGPIPLYLEITCLKLKGRKLNSETLRGVWHYVEREISPISDARGSKEYKSLLLRQLFYAHFIELYPHQFNLEVLV